MNKESMRSNRYFYLDALRACLMYLGILVHVSTLGDSDVFDGGATFSGWFRMETFFLISGFFGGLVLEKYGWRLTMKRRLVALGIPLMSCLLLLNPVTYFLIAKFHNPGISLESYFNGGWTQELIGPANWHLHLWFLFPLLVYSQTLPALIAAMDKTNHFLRKTGFYLQGTIAYTLLAAAAAFTCLAMRVCYEFTLEPWLPGPLLFIIRSTGYYFAFYVLGLSVYRYPYLRDVIMAPRLGHLLISATATFWITHTSMLSNGIVMESATLVSQAWLALSITSIALWTFKKWVDFEHSLIRTMADSAYTVYLLHFIVIYILATVLDDVLGRGQILMVVTAILTAILTTVFHKLVVSRYEWIAFILNGKSRKSTGGLAGGNRKASS